MKKMKKEKRNSWIWSWIKQFLIFLIPRLLSLPFIFVHAIIVVLLFGEQTYIMHITKIFLDTKKKQIENGK